MSKFNKFLKYSFLSHFVTVDNQEFLVTVLLGGDGTVESTVDGIVLQLVDHVVEAHTRVVDGDDLRD